jgi:S-adenosylmethionine:tRNA ribosyltransferase-isomerase
MFISIANIGPEGFSYNLPEERIAMFPVEIRDHSRLLIRDKDGSLHSDIFSKISEYLTAGRHIFFNNSRVIPARLVFRKSTGSHVEIFCLKPLDPPEYAVSLASAVTCVWECMIGNLKRFNTGSLETTFFSGRINHVLRAEKLDNVGNISKIRFSWSNDQVSFAEILQAIGQTPLPPYIKRNPVSIDRDRYQTIYSATDGSVAAPTAGLHFTESVFDRFKQKNISCHEITLHVGAGTFQPIKAKLISEHKMHAEFFQITTDLLQILGSIPEKVISVGTTTVRTLESLYWLGVKLIESSGVPDELTLEQWEPYQFKKCYTLKQSLEALTEWFVKQHLSSTYASTRFMIVPGYRFRVTDTMITNFHQPGSTLLLLVAAFIGDSWKDTYQYALENNFRFLSYGDSSLLFSTTSGRQ